MVDSPVYLVVGLGKTGHSIARYLQRRKRPFVVFDTRKEPSGVSAFREEFPNVDIFTGDFPVAMYDQLTGIISSPGVALDEPVMQGARARGIPIVGDIECLAREIQAPVIAITGTNGKSTVTTLVGEMAAAAGLSVAVAGNIGMPVLDMLDDHAHYDLWVLELSSFQLDLTHSLAPIAATILNVTPDHLDRHHDFELYRQAKQRVYHQASFLLYNREDPFTKPAMGVASSDARINSYGLNPPVDGSWGLMTEAGVTYLAHGNLRILPVEDLRIKGQHNWSNALAACALAHVVGVTYHCMKDVLQHFTGLPHRSQWVRTIDGVDWINDSKGTNIGATISAISGIGEGMQGRIVLIAGGQGKGADFSALRTPVENYVRSVVLMGEDADRIADALMDVVPVRYAPSLDEAVNAARLEAKPGDVVLLSPACASFDMFRDFNHRGESFTALVNGL